MAEQQIKLHETVEHPRGIRSFVRRAGRMTTAQNRAFTEHGKEFLVPIQQHPLDFNQLFDRHAPVVLEIGFGMGDATAHIATVKPEMDFLCCEVHQPGVGALLNKVGEQSIKNIRIVSHDAVEVLEKMIAPNSLAGVHIFFPDPWHKKRHNKRRLIQPELVALLVTRLVANGYIHCATDWQEYAEQILSVFNLESGLQNTSKQDDGYTIKPDYRPLTKFENRGLRLGHGVWDIVFQRKG